MRSSWIGYLLLDSSSATRAAHPSRRTAAHDAVRTAPQTDNNLFNSKGNLRFREETKVLSGLVSVEVTL
jgi:hypothetical protein